MTATEHARIYLPCDLNGRTDGGEGRMAALITHNFGGLELYPPREELAGRRRGKETRWPKCVIYLGNCNIGESDENPTYALRPNAWQRQPFPPRNKLGS